MKTVDLQIVAGGREVSGVCWVPEASRVPAPLVVLGHGLAEDCRSRFHAPVAEVLAREFGIASVALDAPGHGSRRPGPDASADTIWLAYRDQWRADAGAGIAQEIAAAIPEAFRWIRGSPGPIGYWGLSLGTQYGLAFLAREARVRAAVLGLFGAGPVVSRYAMSVRCPVLFLLQEQDELHPKESVEALFTRLASEEKHLLASHGSHAAVPAEVVRAAVEFIARKLLATD